VKKLGPVLSPTLIIEYGTYFLLLSAPEADSCTASL